MNSLNIFLKYLILIVPYVSCENLPLTDIDLNLVADLPYTCCELSEVLHNLSLDDGITNRLNRICWRKDPNENFRTFYLAAVSPESQSVGTAIDVPFKGSQARVTFFNNDKLELKVKDVTGGTWNIVCTFIYVFLAPAFFNVVYQYERETVPTKESFSVSEIRKYPNFNTAENPFSSVTYIYSESDPEKTTFIFTKNHERLISPILIISNGDYKIEVINETEVSLRVSSDEHPYVLHFNDVEMCSQFKNRFSFNAIP